MKKILFLVSVAYCAVSANAQTIEFNGTVELGSDAHVFKVFTKPDCPQLYTPAPGTTGTVVTSEKKLQNDKTEITVKDVVTYGPGSPAFNILANKVIKIPLAPHSDGKANLYLDEKDKTVLYVNYWLGYEVILKPGTKVREFIQVYDCAGNPTKTPKGAGVRTLIETEKYYWEKLKPDSKDLGKSWCRNSEQIEVLNDKGEIEYYLINRYDRNAKYVLELQNRESISYSSPSLYFTAIAIPFKYRFGYKKGDIEIKDDITASANIGLYGGLKLTRYSIINKAGTYTNRTSFSVRFGPFIDFGAAALDSISTTAGKIPMKKDLKQNIATISTGAGLMLDFSGLQFGVFGGWDFGVGADAGNWNYHKRFWVGLGLGYKLTDLFAKKE